MSPTRSVSALAQASVFRLLATAGFAVALPGLAAAQDAGKVGLTASSGSDVGILWNITERIAILPTVALSYRTATSRVIDLDSSFVDPYNIEFVEEERSTFNIGLNIAAQLTVAQRDAFRLYISPSFGKTWSTAGEVLSESNYHLTGAFGARYALNDRFSLFGETGLQYSHSVLEPDLPDFPIDIDLGKTTLSNIGSASRLGVIIYF